MVNQSEEYVLLTSQKVISKQRNLDDRASRADYMNLIMPAVQHPAYAPKPIEYTRKWATPTSWSALLLQFMIRSSQNTENANWKGEYWEKSH